MDGDADAAAWLDEIQRTFNAGSSASPEAGSATLSLGVRNAALAAGRDVRVAEGEGNELTTQTMERKAGDVVRMALFSEYRRKPLRRDEVIKSVLEKETQRTFPVVFMLAQNMLRSAFGYELAELRGRGEENPLLVQQAQELDARMNKRPRTEADTENTGSESRGAASFTGKAYVLRSTLPAPLIAALTEEHTEADRAPAPALDWRHNDGQLGEMGLLFVVLSVILLSGRKVAEGRLRAYLAQLSLSVDRALPMSLQPLGAEEQVVDTGTQSRGRTAGGNELMTLDAFLQMLQRQGYLERLRTTTGAHESEASGTAFEYRWGPRAEMEIGEHAVAAFVSHMYGGPRTVKPEDGAPQQDTAASDAELLKHIERAAGTPLVG